jgi:ElaB/YqjD/DUF883 family membrane-anchored ribosome-binding protein
MTEKNLDDGGVCAVDEHEAHIRREIEYTRAAMSTKVAMIQERVEETVEQTGSTAVRTINNVLERVKQVQDMIEKVASTVDTTMDRVQAAAHQTIAEGKPAFNLIADLHQRPWLIFGAAVIAGYILGSGNRSFPALSAATDDSASGAHPHSFTTYNPTGNSFISPTGSSVGSIPTPTSPRMTEAAGPP